jgi:hypothetical protein
MPREDSRLDAASQQERSEKAITHNMNYEINLTRLTLFTIIEEISREAFTQKVGETYISNDPVLKNALRIAEVSLNQEFLQLDNFTGVERINLNLFDNKSCQVLIDKSNSNASNITTVSIRGKLADVPTAVFFLSMTGVQVLATLRMPDQNLLYTIKYIQLLGQHYLLMAQITEVEQYECEVRIPPRKSE